MAFIDLPAGDAPNLERAFAARPDVLAAWKALNGAIKSGMDLRRYELATLAAARELRSSYCAIAHGSILAREFLGDDAVAALMRGDESALDETERAVMRFAAQVARDATSVTQADVDALRAHGLDDDDVLGVVLAATARCFFSTTLDGLGVQPDAAYAQTVAPHLLEALTVGRPLDTHRVSRR